MLFVNSNYAKTRQFIRTPAYKNINFDFYIPIAILFSDKYAIHEKYLTTCRSCEGYGKIVSW